MILNGYKCHNEDKLNRAVNGSIGRLGQLQGGVGEDATDDAKLAEYDRLGGLITKDGRKVKTGSFYDFKAKKAKEVPEVLLVISDLEGNTVEIPEGEALSPELIAAEQIKARKAEKRAKEVEEKAEKKAAKAAKKNKQSVEDEE